ncbi:MAG: hypothetical protein QGG36_30955 [Pirellulaceae bacterium]|jgi:hypothetical protein|nr:hypothetical protein [Pirellulaceae bacterium]MDP7020257.1 hypothetical protein [Pirellulaceae bacterium]
MQLLTNLMESRVVWTVAIVAGALVGGSSHGQDARKSRKRREVLREGTHVQWTGRFMGGGDEPTTFRRDDHEESYRVLENLALERVSKTDRTSERRSWDIAAELTEFQGSNYLLLKRATLKSKKTPHSSPAR